LDKRYQVFISSTFADLKEERGKVQQAVMELDCIPAGMELFPAIDQEQFEFIKKVIDDCDYYLLIIGGRYGSVSDEGVSYTEMEYHYAVSKGIKVIALLHEDPSTLPVKKSEMDFEARQKLSAFRDIAANGRLVRFWTEANQLPGLTLSSLVKTMRAYPAVGWVRGNSVADPELYKELAALRKENQELRAVAATQPVVMDLSGLAGFQDEVEVHGNGKSPKNGSYITLTWQAVVTWGELFGFVGAELLSPQGDLALRRSTAQWLKNKSNRANDSLSKNDLLNEDYQTMKIQFRALGLIESDGDLLEEVWHLTKAGEREMISLRVVRKTSTIK